MLLFGTLERVIAEASGREAALLAARDEWAARAGAVHDEDPFYEERTAAFLDWFALDRRLEGGRTPVEELLAARPEAAPDRAALTALASSHRSLFRVRERVLAGPDSGLLLDDLWGGAHFHARERRNLAGVERGDLLDARLCADVGVPDEHDGDAPGTQAGGPEVLLVRIACVHPRQAEPAILKLVAAARRTGEAREELLFRLLRLRLRCERYRHVHPARVYEAGEGR